LIYRTTLIAAPLKEGEHARACLASSGLAAAISELLKTVWWLSAILIDHDARYGRVSLFSIKSSYRRI